MKKNKNKGFTLIELLAVIVILAILVAVAIPAVTRYLNTARRGTYASNAQAAISVVRNDVISTGVVTNKKYTLEQINALLEKKLQDSPYGSEYSANSYVYVSYNNTTGEGSYSICLMDGDGNGFIGATSDSLSKSSVPEREVTEENVTIGLSGRTCYTGTTH